MGASLSTSIGAILVLLFLPMGMKGGDSSIHSQSHPFYLSVTEIQYNAQDKVLEIAVKLFVSDLEAALQERYQQTMNLGLTNEHSDAEVYLALYLREQLQIRFEGVALPQTYLGNQPEQEVLWCYLTVPMPRAPRSLYVRNALLTDQFEEQQNLVHLNVAGQRESLILQRGKLAEEVIFE